MIAPKKGVQEQFNHLRVLTRFSKLLREASLRELILQSTDAAQAYGIVCDADDKLS